MSHKTSDSTDQNTVAETPSPDSQTMDKQSAEKQAQLKEIRKENKQILKQIQQRGQRV